MKEALPGAAKLSRNRMAVVSWLEWVGVKCLGRLLRAVDVGVRDAGVQSARGTTNRPRWTPDALRLRIDLPTRVSLQPPAKFPPCPCVSCCAALEASFSSDCPDSPLILAPALLVQHHDTAALLERTSSIIPESATSTLPNTDVAHS